MICSNCGQNIPGGMQCTCTAGEGRLVSYTAADVVRNIILSGQFLAMMILSGASIIITFLAGIFNRQNVVNEIINLFEEFDSRIDMSQFMAELDKYQVQRFNLMSLPVMEILMVIGMIMLYLSAKNSMSGQFFPQGITIFKVVKIIQTIGAAFAIVAIVLLVVFFSALRNSLGISGEIFDIMFLVVIAIVAIACVFVVLTIVYNVKFIKTMNTVKYSAETGVVNLDVSSYVIAMNWVFGIISFGSVSFSIVVKDLSGAATVCSAISLIIFSMLLTRYKKDMTELHRMVGYNNYGGQNYGYQNAPQTYTQPNQYVPPVQTQPIQSAPQQPPMQVEPQQYTESESHLPSIEEQRMEENFDENEQ